MPLLGTRGAVSAKGFGFTGSSAKIGWIATLSQTVLAGANAFRIAPVGGKLYVGVRNANSGNQPGGLIRIDPASPSIDYSSWYIRSAGTIGDEVGSLYVTNGSVYANFVASTNFPYFLKYNASTGSLTTQLLGSNFNESTNAGPITSDSSGNLFTSFDSTVGGLRVLSITKFNSSLTAQWGFQFSNPTDYEGSFGQQGATVSVTDSSGNIYVGGKLSGSGDSNQSGYAGVIKLNTSGTNQWIKGYGQTGSGATQTGAVQAMTINGAGNLVLTTAVSDSTTGVYVFEINPSTGAYTGTKKSVTFSTNTGNYQSAKGVFDSSGNLYIVMSNTSTTAWIAKVNAALDTVTAIKLTRTGAGSLSIYSVNTDGTDLYFYTSNSTSTGSVYFKIPTTLTSCIGASATIASATYSFSAATGSIANNTFANNPTPTLTKTTNMASWSAGGLTSSPKTPAITSASF